MIREVNRFGHDRGLAMFADWSSRIAAGELPPAPPRPQGIERNVVVTLWEIDTDKSFIHDVIGTNDWNTSANAYGPLYTLDWMSAEIWALNPKDNTVAKLASNPFRDENERKLMRAARPPDCIDSVSLLGQPSDLDRSQPHRHAAYGQQGPDLVSCQEPAAPFRLLQERLRKPVRGEFPDAGRSAPRRLENYDPKTGKFDLLDVCLTPGHLAFGNDKDETVYYTDTAAVPPRMGGVGWVQHAHLG